MNAQIETSKADAGKEAEKNRQLTVTVGISFLHSPKYTASHWRLLATHGQPHHDNHTKERPSTPNVVKRRRTRHKPKTKARRIGPTNTGKKQAAKQEKNATWPFPTIQPYDATIFNLCKYVLRKRRFQNLQYGTKEENLLELICQ